MRIHSDYLLPSDIFGATVGLPGVIVTATSHGSRSHRGAFEVSLESTSNSRKNSGKYGAGDEYAATWDEWGVFLARLFNLDANAVMGSVKHPTYRNAEHFHAVTGNRFESLELPEDTHKRHNWQYSVGVTECTKCSATRPRVL